MLRSLWNCYSACATCLFTLAVVLAIAAALLVVSAGVVTVPILSDLLPTVDLGSILVSEEPDEGLPPIVIDPEAPERLQQRIEKLLEPGAPFDIEITETELNSIVAEITKENPDFPLKDMRVRLLDGGLARVTGRIEEPFRATIGLLARVGVQDQQLQVSIEEAKLGKVPLPGGMLTPVLGPLIDNANQQLREGLGKSGGSLDLIEIAAGKIRVVGTVPKGD